MFDICIATFDMIKLEIVPDIRLSLLHSNVLMNFRVFTSSSVNYSKYKDQDFPISAFEQEIKLRVVCEIIKDILS